VNELLAEVLVLPAGTVKEIIRRLARIERALGIVIEKEDQIMTDQEHLDADVAAVEAVVTDLATATVNIQAELDALKTAHPAVDFTGLDAAVASLAGAQAGVDALETPPAAESAPAE
jgi:hypothetical protein